MPPKSQKPFQKPQALADWQGPTLLLMDGTYFVFRAYHALPPLSTRTGVPTHAAYGFTTMLLKALREVNPTHAAVAFDLGGSDARLAIAPDYKAHRGEPPEDLAPQFDLVRRVARALGLPVLEERGVEADDILGTLTRAAAREGFFTVLLAGDKDFMQIVDERTLLLDTMYDRWVGPAEVLEKTGVRPDQIVEYMALLGDEIDNIAGIPGVGPKTAAQLIQQFGTVEALLARLPEVPKDKLRDKLREHAAGIKLARRLVELKLDVALPLSLGALIRREPDPAPLLQALRGARVHAPGAQAPAPGQAAASAPSEKPALAFAPPAVLSAVEPARAAIAWLSQQPRIALHAELAGAGERPNALVGLALAAGQGEGARSFYFPLAHDGFGGRLASDAQLALAKLVADPAVAKVGFGLKQAATALRTAGTPALGLAFDCELALYLVDPGRREHAAGRHRAPALRRSSNT